MKVRHFAVLASFAIGVVSLTGVVRGEQRTYGTTATSALRVGMTEFVPLDSSLTYTDRAITGIGFSRSATSTAGFGAFAATVHLPSGALVTEVEFDGCDSSAAMNLSYQVQSSLYTGLGPVVEASAGSSGTGGCGFDVATLGTPFQIDNNEKQLILVAYVPTTDGTTSISGAIVRYHLQVSPAPPTATFPDVPTTDFGFQYVQALVQSGVTGGCGSGLYCPDSFVTRRQMAIFLAKALGLQFP